MNNISKTSVGLVLMLLAILLQAVWPVSYILILFGIGALLYLS